MLVRHLCYSTRQITYELQFLPHLLVPSVKRAGAPTTSHGNADDAIPVAPISARSGASVPAELDEHIGGLRAQLLRSEQEKELMRVKLEEALSEKELVMREVGRRTDCRLPWSIVE